MINSDRAFLIVVAGVTGVIYELLRPGLILPGVAGAGGLLAGCFHLLTGSPRPHFLLTGIVAAAFLFLMESLSPRPYVSGVLATLALTFAFVRGGSVRLTVAIPVCLAVGWIFTLLLQQGRRARLNKAM